MTERFVHYTNSKSSSKQPILLGSSTADLPASVLAGKPVIGHSFDMTRFPSSVRDNINWGIRFLLSEEQETSITLGTVETRRANG